MKQLTSKRNLVVVALIFLCLGLTTFGVFSSAAHATAVAETKATAYCSKISDANDLATQQRAACQVGFVKGYDGTAKDKTEACKSFTLSKKTACEAAFTAGKNAKADAPVTDGREGAKAGISKEDACKKYKNAANLAACKKAYDNQIIAMAEIEGKKAGEAGQDSPCAKYKLAAAKTACENAYKAGQLTLGRSARGHCGEVATYFDFSKTICKDPDLSVKSGGNNSPIIAIGLGIVGIVTSLVAIAVVGGIIYGGFLYLTARDNSGQTEKGVTIIVNSVVALIVWVFAYALINFLIPGGLFNG